MEWQYGTAECHGIKFHKSSDQIRWTYKGERFCYPCKNHKDVQAIADFISVFLSVVEDLKDVEQGYVGRNGQTFNDNRPFGRDGRR